MKNYEKYDEELYKILIDSIAVTKKGILTKCKDTVCEKCIFLTGIKDCKEHAREWLNSDENKKNGLEVKK